MLNGWLRGNIAAKIYSGHHGIPQIVSFKRLVQHTENAIQKFELPTPITVHRYMEATPELVHKFANSDTFIEHAFMSTSAISKVDPELVKKFKTKLSSYIHLEINVPKGSGQGVYIAPLSHYPNQCEFLIDRGAKLKIDDVEPTEDGINVKCRLIGFEKRNLEDLKTMRKSINSKLNTDKDLYNSCKDYFGTTDESEDDKWDRFIGKLNDVEFQPNGK